MSPQSHELCKQWLCTWLTLMWLFSSTGAFLSTGHTFEKQFGILFHLKTFSIAGIIVYIARRSSHSPIVLTRQGVPSGASSEPVDCFKVRIAWHGTPNHAFPHCSGRKHGPIGSCIHRAQRMIAPNQHPFSPDLHAGNIQPPEELALWEEPSHCPIWN